MNIAQVVSTYPPYHGGMGNVAHAYTERLRARGEDVHVFTPRFDREIPEDPDFVHRVPSPLSVGNAAAVPSLFRRLSGFDLVHLHYPFFGGAEPTIVRKALRGDQALVVTYHMDTHANGLKGLAFEAHRRALFPWLIARADRVLVSSLDYARSSALAALPKLADRLVELPFGVDGERFHPGDASETRARLSLGSGPTVLFVGGLDEAHAFKGVPVLLEALARIAAAPTPPPAALRPAGSPPSGRGGRVAPWNALIVGDGDLRAAYEAEARRLGMAERVRFLGAVADEALPDLYRASQVHVLPSVSSGEAFGLVALEAAASGVPSVVSDLPGVRSVVLHGETGWCVPAGDAAALADALRTLLPDAALRERLGLAARARVLRDYAWDPLMDRLEEVYREGVESLGLRPRS